ncbi:MAG: hypothetical protein HQ495_00155 [Alphaproteobacteria bacterium]|nr:hypothetical protein [Alphaproteobacteria bacterium]
MTARMALVRDGIGMAGWGIGGGVILLAAVRGLSGTAPAETIAMVQDALGGWFVAAALVLTLIALVAWHRVRSAPSAHLWYEVGAAASNGLVTLALTFTLVGISAGITTLHGRPLTPETVQPIIAELGHAFGRAFLTTIVGLPLAAVLRALLAVAMTARDDTAGAS